MTPQTDSSLTPEPRKQPQITGRMMCIISGPALTVARPAAPKQDGKGWEVLRRRWQIDL